MAKKSSLPINLDEKVILTLITTGILSIAIVFWSFRNSSEDPCSQGSIVIKSNSHYTGELIGFTSDVKNIELRSLAWGFGDNHDRNVNGKFVYHGYAIPGRYKVSLTINGTCRKDTVIDIIQRKISGDGNPQPAGDSNIHVIIKGPKVVYVGRQAAFKDSTPMATRWEWKFGETGLIDATIQSPSYIFRTRGTKKITLKVNGKIEGYTSVNVKRFIKVKIPPKKTDTDCSCGPKTPILKVQLENRKIGTN